jgi:hypothetical protein
MKPQPGTGRRDVKEKQEHKIKEKYMREKGKNVFLTFLSVWLILEDVTDRLNQTSANTSNYYSTLCNITEERRY